MPLWSCRGSPGHRHVRSFNGGSCLRATGAEPQRSGDRMTARPTPCRDPSSADARRTAVPLYFGPDGAELFGWFHRPDGSAAGPVIVICPPAGLPDDHVASGLRHLAEALLAPACQHFDSTITVPAIHQVPTTSRAGSTRGSRVWDTPSRKRDG